MVKTYHMELTRAGPICIRYLENAIQLAESWEMTQVLFWLCIFLHIEFFFYFRDCAILPLLFPRNIEIGENANIVWL
jgi:hypothetical protein